MKKTSKNLGIVYRDSVDVVQKFEAHGLKCAVIVNPFGGCNGYVQLPEKTPARWVNYDSIPVEAHGGLTYGPDEGRWVGFDTLHAGDYWMGEVAKGKEKHSDIISEDRNSGWAWSKGWTVELVADECRSIAKQIASKSRRYAKATPKKKKP